MLIVVFGLPGSGKSFFARHFAKKLQAYHINTDKIRDQIQARGKYKESDKKQVYDLMVKQTAELLKKQQKVVVDGTFYRHNLRLKFSDLATRNHVECFFLQILARESLIKERLQRTRKDSEADYEVYLKVKDAFEDMAENHLKLHSKEGNIDEMMRKASHYINR